MNDCERYTYRVFWSDEDQEYVGTCLEFEGLSHLDDSPYKALAGIRELVAAVVEDAKNDGDLVPEPLSTRKYSGTITLRIPPDTHRALAMDAAEAGVSMNRLAAERLTLRR